MEPSDRELWRELERVDPDPDDPDPADMWEAFLEGKHPDEMDTKAEADAIRACYLTQVDGAEPRDVDDLHELDKEVLDDQIRRSLE